MKWRKVYVWFLAFLIEILVVFVIFLFYHFKKPHIPVVKEKKFKKIKIEIKIQKSSKIKQKVKSSSQKKKSIHAKSNKLKKTLKSLKKGLKSQSTFVSNQKEYLNLINKRDLSIKKQNKNYVKFEIAGDIDTITKYFTMYHLKEENGKIIDIDNGMEMTPLEMEALFPYKLVMKDGSFYMPVRNIGYYLQTKSETAYFCLKNLGKLKGINRKEVVIVGIPYGIEGPNGSFGLFLPKYAVLKNGKKIKIPISCFAQDPDISSIILKKDIQQELRKEYKKTYKNRKNIPFSYYDELNAEKNKKYRLRLKKYIVKRIKKYLKIIRECSKKFNVPEELIIGVIMVESSGSPLAANSKTSAKGLMQIVDSTYREIRRDLKNIYGISIKQNPFDVYSNIVAGSYYLKKLYNYTGSWEKAIEYYYAGPGYEKLISFNKMIRYKNGTVVPLSSVKIYKNKVIKFAYIYKTS